MEIKITLPDYSPDDGFKFQWESNFTIEVRIEGNAIKILANQAGLKSLAYQLLNLSQAEFPPGYHIHLDAFNSLEEGSNDLLIEKTD